MNTYKIEKANEIPDAQAVTEPYSEDAIRVGVLRDMIEARDAEIAQIRSTGADMIEQQARIIKRLAKIRSTGTDTIERQGAIIEQQREQIGRLGEQLQELDDLGDLIARTQAAEIVALKTENERLLGCVRELEREELEKPHQGFSSYDAFADAREWAESPHSDHQDGRVDNTTGAFAHLI